MKAIWDRIWNEPVIFITMVMLVANTIIIEAGDGLPEWVRITLVIVVTVGGLLTTRSTVSPTSTYIEKNPAHRSDA